MLNEKPKIRAIHAYEDDFKKFEQMLRQYSANIEARVYNKDFFKILINQFEFDELRKNKKANQ